MARINMYFYVNWNNNLNELELDKTCYERIRSLVTELAAYNVAIPALLDGINPGRVFVDDRDHPQAAYLDTVEGRHLVGDAANDAFIAALQVHFTAHMPSWGIDVTVPSDAWVERLALLRSSLSSPSWVLAWPAVMRRAYFTCSAPIAG